MSVKIYTRKGDAGRTRLADGTAISKADLRLECLGTLDELSACLGLACEFVAQPTGAMRETRRLDLTLRRVQEQLSHLEADLAAPARKPRITARQAAWLEREIDRWSAMLPDLRDFILPGGGPAGASLHLARTLCRRAERNVVRLAQHEPVAGVSLVYLNRLSDALFTAARLAAKLGGFSEKIVGDGRGLSEGRRVPG